MKSRFVWSHDITLTMCCLISTDGCISLYKYKTPFSLIIKIITSVDKEYVEFIASELKCKNINCSLLREINYRNRLSDKAIYNLVLSKRRKPSKQYSSNQHQILRNSIVYHGLEGYLMARKYAVLCKCTEKPNMKEGWLLPTRLD